jgi:hypothetical protein
LNSTWGRIADSCMKTVQATFGEEVIYSPSSGPKQSIRGIFRTHFLGIETEAGVGVGTMCPSLEVRLLDLQSPPKAKDQSLIRDVQYKVTEVKPDQEGGALLILMRIERI